MCSFVGQLIIYNCTLLNIMKLLYNKRSIILFSPTIFMKMKARCEKIVKSSEKNTETLNIIF